MTTPANARPAVSPRGRAARAASAALGALALGFGSALVAPLLGRSDDAPPPVAAAPAPRPAWQVATDLEAPDFFAPGDETSAGAELQMAMRRQGAAEVWRQHVAPALVGVQDVEAAAADGEPTVAELEALRAQVDAFYGDLEGALGYIEDHRRLDVLESLREARAGIADYSYEDLARLHDIFQAYPGFWSVGAYAEQVMAGVSAGSGALESQSFVDPLEGVAPLPVPGLLPFQTREPSVPSTGPGDYGNCNGYGGSGTCSNCPPQPAGGISTVFALQTAAFVAQSVCSYFDGDITLFGQEIPNFAKIICIVAYGALQITADAVKFANDLNGECEDDYHRGLTDAYLDATVSSRATQKSHDFHRLYTLRIAIENAMLEEADERLGLFQLPASEDGYLDAQDDVSVRYVVSDTIKTMQLAGYDVRNALDEYAAAELHLDREEYKDAFARYRLAYRAAVRVGREP